MLRLINTPENVFADSKLYLDIYIMGLPFVFFYNVATGIFSALGDSKTPFIFLACSSTVATSAWTSCSSPRSSMGVAGVAWATFLCQGVSCVLAMAVRVPPPARASRPRNKSAIFSLPLFCRIARNRRAEHFAAELHLRGQHRHSERDQFGFGSAVMAGYSAAVKLNNLVITSLTTLGNGISNFTAQNLGASKMDRMRDGFRAGLKLVWMLCLPLVALYLLGGRTAGEYLHRTSPSEAAMATGVQFLRIVSPFYFIGFLQAGFRRRAARCGADERSSWLRRSRI